MDNRGITNQKLRQDVLYFILQCNIPINAVNSAAFQQLLANLRAPGTINRDIIGREITATYQIERAKVESLLVYLNKAEGQKFSICIDCWTTKTQHAFLGVTIHYINKQWQQESFLLALADLRRRHTGLYLYKTLNKVLEGYSISQSILAVTRDNAGNNQTLMAEFQEHYGRSAVGKSVYSIPCVDHVLNLVCQSILKKLNAEIDESEITKIAIETQEISDEEAERIEREIQLGLSQSQPRKRSRAYTRTQAPQRRTKVAPEGLNLFSKIRRIVGKLRQQQHLIRSLQRNMDRFQAQSTNQRLPSLRKPTLDMPVRWNSTYYMLTNFARLRRPIEQVIRHYPGDFINLSLNDSDWLLITRLQQSLSRIQRISVFFQASTGYPTLSLVLPMVYKLDQYLNEVIQSADTT